MILAKIDYLNLLPFHIFLKKYIKSTRLKKSIECKKSYPAKINRDFKARRVNGAFISSIASRGKKCTNAGIIANKEVLSVLVFSGKSQSDYQSETSNALAKVLKIDGEIMIGDRALKRYFDGEESIDLAEQWHKKYGLPFVFARFCYNSNPTFFKKTAKNFLRKRKSIKIPQYILIEYAKKTEIEPQNILYYLTKIYYKMGYREKLALKKFLGLAKGVK